MIFEQIYLDCLSHASYLLGADGCAAVVDPRRDVEIYLDVAARHGLEIRHAIATHVHADFVTGLRELADRTGATIWMGERFSGSLACERLADDQVLELGSVELRAIATPGHTIESICLLVIDSAARDEAARLLTGDTLFVDEVGRPDLIGVRGGSAEAMAAMLFDSLHERILTLDDTTEIWPAHGAGSACGKSIGTARSSTIGMQRVQNWALQPQSRADFVQRLCADLPPPPSYFEHTAAINRCGARLTRERPRLRELGETECSISQENGAALVDVRPAAAYGEGHHAGAINVSLGGRFAEWCARLIEPGRRIVLLAAERPQAEEGWLRLARVGHDHVIGWCPVEAAGATEQLAQQDVASLKRAAAAGSLQIVDVRSPAEFERGHVPGAVTAPLYLLPEPLEQLDRLDRGRPTAIVCETGQRSSCAAHFLRARGFRDLRNVAGGTRAWRSAGFAVEIGSA